MRSLDFPTIVSAVPPRKRSPQYYVLAALYCLGAHRQPVTARKVTDLLKAHLRGKAPENIPGRLRKYEKYVHLQGAERPLRWRLSHEGLQELRTQSDLELATDTAEQSFESDIGIVCALDNPELAAVIAAGGGEPAWTSVGNASFPHLYQETRIETVEGQRLRVVATTSTSMGLTAAAIATTHLVFQFRPRIVVMIGIAAGTRSGKKQFGDVLVADPSVDYNSGKVVVEGGIREFQPDPYPLGLNARLRSVLQKYRRSHSAFAQIAATWKGKTPPLTNRLHLGPLGAADQVIDDASRVLEIQRNWRKLVGVEMETYGVYRACHEAPEPRPRFVSFKSVCDFAAEKTDSWQDYAAFVAARFAFYFFQEEWAALWPK